MTLSKRDAHLKDYFSADQLKGLDEAEKTVLYEEFSNSQLKVLASQEMGTIHTQLKRYLTAENHRRLSQIQPEEYELLKPWYLETCHTVDEIICSKCGVLLGLEVDTIDDEMNPYHHEGKFVVAVGNKLMSYRPRLDGVMGYQCGNIIETKYKSAWDKYGEDFAQFQKDEARAKEQHEDAILKYNNLSEKKREKTEQPVYEGPVTPEKPEGEPYEECTNDTRWAQIEIDNVPQDHVMTSITKEDRIKVKQEMNATNYAPDVKTTKRGKKVESFELRKVK